MLGVHVLEVFLFATFFACTVIFLSHALDEATGDL